MKPKYKTLKIALDHPELSVQDIEDLERWEGEGGATGDNADIFSSLSLTLPIHKKEIFEVVDSELVIEEGKIYLKADINILSLH